MIATHVEHELLRHVETALLKAAALSALATGVATNMVAAGELSSVAIGAIIAVLVAVVFYIKDIALATVRYHRARYFHRLARKLTDEGFDEAKIKEILDE